MNHSKETVLKTVAELFDLVKEKQSKVDELQKRVDAALTILSSKKKMYVDMVIEIEQALKGGEDE